MVDSRRSLPPVGTVLYGHLRKPRSMVVPGQIIADSAAPEGRVLEVGGVRYRTLSKAAKALTGQERNGWAWWRTEDGRPIGEQDPTT